MLSYPQYESEIDVVFQVFFNYIGTETVTIQTEDPITKQTISIDKTYVAQFSDSVSVSYQTGDTFIPYENLTPTQVINWIESVVNPSVISAWQTLITNNINNQINPTEQQLPLPWTNN